MQQDLAQNVNTLDVDETKDMTEEQYEEFESPSSLEVVWNIEQEEIDNEILETNKNEDIEIKNHNSRSNEEEINRDLDVVCNELVTAEYEKTFLSRTLNKESKIVDEENLNALPVDKNDEIMDNDMNYLENEDWLDVQVESPNTHLPETIEMIQQKLREKVNECDLDKEKKQELIEMLFENTQAFGCDGVYTGFNKLSPMTVKLKPNVTTFSSQPYSMGPNQRDILRKKLAKMIKNGLLVRDKDSYCSSPVLILPKPQNRGFRMVIDLRRLNGLVEELAGTLPDLNQQLSWIPAGTEHYACFDALSGFDYMPLEPSSTGYFGLATPFGVFKLLGSPQGYVNTPTVYQERITHEILGGIQEHALFGNNVLQWLDDSFLFARSWEEFVKKMNKFLKNCIKKNFRLNIKKCEFHTTKATWCGRNISKGKWKFSQQYFNKILKIKSPENIGQLEDIIYVSQWLSNQIPVLSKLRKHFAEKHKLLVGLAKKRKRTTKRSRKSFIIKSHWSAEDDAIFKEFLKKLSICSEQWLLLYNPQSEIAIHTDASIHFWSSIICQKDAQGKWQPLAFLSGEFTHSEINWSMTSKELYPILKSLRRFKFLFLAHQKSICVWTDHRNLIYLMDDKKDLRSSTQGRLQRWILELQIYKLNLIYVRGEDNVFPDILTRWAYPGPTELGKYAEKAIKNSEKFMKALWRGIDVWIPKNEVSIKNILEDKKKLLKEADCVGEINAIDEVSEDIDKLQAEENLEKYSRMSVSYLNPFRSSEKWHKVNFATIRKFQSSLSIKDIKKNKFEKNADRLYVKDGKIVIPIDLRPRLVVQSHIDSGHGAFEETMRHLKAFWFVDCSTEQLSNEIKCYLRLCLHCEG